MTFFFYDLETSGINPRESRVMQFAGQRTDMQLKPIGKPFNILIKLTEDVLPDPDAVLVHGTTPQKTVSEGISEAEFVKLFNEEILQPDTVFVGFNSIRFDDEFMRFLFYRNFNDAYEWQWRDGCSRWDLLDVTRMTRALRPEGIKWPFAPDGKPSNRLELLSSINKLDHDDAHDALSDVKATIAVAKLIKDKQPKLFDYLLNLRSKRAVKGLVEREKMFIYSSGKYSGEFEKTAVVARLCPHPDKNGVLVYDLRHDPTPYLKMSPEELVESWRWKPPKSSQVSGVQGAGEQRTEPYKEYGEGVAEPATQQSTTSISSVASSTGQQAGVMDDLGRLPVKSLQYNRCPAVAPLGVLDDASKKRLRIDLKMLQKHLDILNRAKNFEANLIKAIGIINAGREAQVELVDNPIDVDARLYEGFIPDTDRNLAAKIRVAKPDDITSFKNKFSDNRLKNLVILYKARNFAKYLSDEERSFWEDYRAKILSSRLSGFTDRLKEISERPGLSKDQLYLLEELQLWAENIVPDVN